MLAWCGLPLVHAQDAGSPPALRSSPLLQDKIPDSVRSQLPVFVRGDRIEGQTDLNTVVEGMFMGTAFANIQAGFDTLYTLAASDENHVLLAQLT